MTDMPPSFASRKPLAVWLVLLAAAATFAMTMGTRQTMGLSLSALNTSTGLGMGASAWPLPIGTFITPFMTSTAGLIFAIGVLAAGGVLPQG